MCDRSGDELLLPEPLRSRRAAPPSARQRGSTWRMQITPVAMDMLPCPRQMSASPPTPRSPRSASPSLAAPHYEPPQRGNILDPALFIEDVSARSVGQKGKARAAYCTVHSGLQRGDVEPAFTG
ncbi:hypothetical protein AAFF_G00278700 [Aldrovandia affinis]|uniref:Uncharacterized protein n=1 Tax=Aldrovandia affinis TaxID=143900 RepID=A0AAD7SRJ6_9TELE|nr:hypothetical protein AAFF_G00278700 [Aldrovandia affinis]